MGRIPRLFVLAVVLLIVAPISGFAREVRISAAFSPQETEMLKNDLARHFDFIGDTSAINKLLSVPVAKGALEEWFTQRVGYIIEDQKDLSKNVQVMGVGYQYDNPGLYPDEAQELINAENENSGSGGGGLSEVTPTRTDDGVIEEASNIGAALYVLGKVNKVLLAYMFRKPTGIETVPITSPRTGLIKIGGLLKEPRIDKYHPEAAVNSFFRITSLIHEARHSDGNGKSLSFFHANCPANHLYANLAACDANANGPYSVGAAIMDQVSAECRANKTCTPGQAWVLGVYAKDSRERMLDRRFVDDRPEGH